MTNLNPKHPFYSANDFYRERFNTKIIKLSIDGGFTCPNRDGTLSNKGCIFCSSSGSGDFAGNRQKSVTEQYYDMINKMRDKWSHGKYIIYFQAFTNTYAPIKILNELYNEALSLPDVVGLSIATRPDCINDEVLNLLEQLNKKTFIQVEIGLQSSKSESISLINRCYENDVYKKAVNDLKSIGVNVVTHIILGLPDESYNDMLNSVKYTIDCGTDGLKLQLLHILKDTNLYKYYMDKPFKIFTYDEYIKTVADIIEQIPQNTVIHRITGDAPKSILFEPWWSLNKRRVLNGISKEFIARNTYQGTKI